MNTKKQETETTLASKALPSSSGPEHSLLSLMADIRAAAGDPEGKLMQDELIDWIAALRMDRDRIDFLSEDKGAITSAACEYVTRTWHREYTFRQAVDAAIIASNLSQNAERSHEVG